MASIDIDIDDVSKKLDDRWDELSDLAVDPGGSGTERINRRKQIDFWQSDILVKQTMLDEIKADRKAAQITVKQLTRAEADAAQQALQDLNKQIQQDQVWQNVIDVVTAVLGAASTVVKTAAK